MLEMKAADIERRFFVVPVADWMQTERPREQTSGPISRSSANGNTRREGKNVKWNSMWDLWGDTKLSAVRVVGSQKGRVRGLGQRTI